MKQFTMEIKKVANLLINEGAKINSKCKNLMTPLHYSVYSIDASCSSLLIEKGAKVDDKDSFGFTPIQHAAYINNIPSLLVLVQQEQREKEILRNQNADTEKKLNEIEVYNSTKIQKLVYQLKEKTEIARSFEISALRLQGAPGPDGIQNLSYKELCELELKQEEGLRRIRDEKVQRLTNENKLLLCVCCEKNKFNQVFNCGHKYCGDCGESASVCVAVECGNQSVTKIPIVFH